jgi:hypothetical protein
LKFELIIELSQWLYAREFPLSTCVDLCEWAIDLIIHAGKASNHSRTISAGTSLEPNSGRQSKARLAKKPPKQRHQNLINIIKYDQKEKIIIKRNYPQLDDDSLEKIDSLTTELNTEPLFGR